MDNIHQLRIQVIQGSRLMEIYLIIDLMQVKERRREASSKSNSPWLQKLCTRYVLIAIPHCWQHTKASPTMHYEIKVKWVPFLGDRKHCIDLYIFRTNVALANCKTKILNCASWPNQWRWTVDSRDDQFRMNIIKKLQ